MAKRGTQKQFSLDQENLLAFVLGGVCTRNTGAGDIEKGDVVFKDADMLLEAKYTGDLDNPAKSISIKLEDLEKITDEAYASNATPALAFRITNPASRIADRVGHVDWVAVPLGDFGYLLDLCRQVREETP